MAERDDTTKPAEDAIDEPTHYQGLVRVRAVNSVTEIIARPEPPQRDPDEPPPPKPNFHREMVIVAAPGPAEPEEPKPKPNLRNDFVVLSPHRTRTKVAPSIGSMPVPGGRK